MSVLPRNGTPCVSSSTYDRGNRGPLKMPASPPRVSLHNGVFVTDSLASINFDSMAPERCGPQSRRRLSCSSQALGTIFSFKVPSYHQQRNSGSARLQEATRHLYAVGA